MYFFWLQQRRHSQVKQNYEVTATTHEMENRKLHLATKVLFLLYHEPLS